MSLLLLTHHVTRCKYIERKQWDYGKGLQLMWGDQPVRVADEKWLFMFETTPKSSPI
ncbi:hypothetical protein K443DRAFT_113037 [Laccaria amethystina LaAM-08-1]|uniref:Uncharacterized protein n=1 Tax=Laccaria amethystina LaAM-08-1 TaxID=1095629 RepID=A0A0C9X559_9AGAR|nr:hypothetical protein K443DRAFT_113037 [Laccaria amethystina LaAM-08-1]